MNTMDKIKKCIWGLEPKDRHCEFCTAYCELRPKENSIATTSILIPQTIKATIDKSADGLYCISSDYKIGDSYLGGYGLSLQSAKRDFEGSIGEAVVENIKVEYELLK